MNVNGFEWKDVKVLVTGASGFKGGWLSAVLKELGAKVYGTVQPYLNPYSSYHLLSVKGKISRIQLDVTDVQKVFDTINTVSPDIIFHLAAKALVPTALRDPKRAFEVNVMGTLNIIEACRDLKVGQKILVCSMDHVFGSYSAEDLPKSGFKEITTVGYGGPYDTSKAAMELATRCYHETFADSLPAIGITRCANVYGYGDVNQRRVIPEFINSSIEKGIVELTCRKNGRQFIHVIDAIAGYIKAASSMNLTKQSGHAHNHEPFTPTFHFALDKYGNKKTYVTIEELAKIISSAMKSQIVVNPHCVSFIPHENKVQALNCHETKKRLDWEPKIDFRDSLRKMGDWYKALNKNDIEQLEGMMHKDLEIAVETVGN